MKLVGEEPLRDKNARPTASHPAKPGDDQRSAYEMRYLKHSPCSHLGVPVSSQACVQLRASAHRDRSFQSIVITRFAPS
jgi:hypothetical protein